MNAISADNNLSDSKESNDLLISNHDILLNSVPISGSCMLNIMSNISEAVSSEVKYQSEMDENSLLIPTSEASTSSSSNSSHDVSYLSMHSPTSQTVFNNPIANSPTNSEATSGSALSNKSQLNPVSKHATLEKSSSSFAIPETSFDRFSNTPANFDTTHVSASDNSKDLVEVCEDGIDLARKSSSTILLSYGMEQSNADTSNGDTTTTNQISCSSSQSDSMDSSTCVPIKRHTGYDSRWEAIQLANLRSPPLGLGHFKLINRLGYGDIGSVYLVELKDTGEFFAMKVMDRASLISRNKLIRTQIEREILSLLDHPFLPTLYSHFETDKFSCLVMEFCSGGNLHSLRQKQPSKYFSEQAARFYASEILLALEYLHMLGVVYRDLKPENVLVREEGHIMLSDFDLSLRCSVNPTLVKSCSTRGRNYDDPQGMLDADRVAQGCIQPTAFFPRILPKRNRKSKSDFGLAARLPELMAEPINARSMSFVGTHEYLAPEIIRGEGHGSAVDWWTFGIFIYELIYGTTPFKGSGNRATLYNVVGQPLRFPDEPVVSSSVRDLIRGLLVKDPQRRIACRRGATEIKQHPFFEGVSWALVRSMHPPHIPQPVDFDKLSNKDVSNRKKNFAQQSGCTDKHSHSGDADFEYF